MKTVHVPASRAEREESAGAWGSLRWMASESISKSSVTVGRLTIRQGQSGERHRHANADEVIYLIRGRICVRAEEEAVALEPGDALTVPAGLAHHIENIGNGDAEMTLSYSSGRREYEAG